MVDSLHNPDNMEIQARVSQSQAFDCPAIDKYATKHLHARHDVLNKTLARAHHTCRSNALPDWCTIASQGKFIMLQVQMARAKNVLEVGTLGGQNAIWCAAAEKDVRVTTIEINKEYAEVARTNFQDSGIQDRVESIVGNAQYVLRELREEIGHGRRDKFDFVLIDVEDMAKTWELVDLSVGVCVARACLFVHCAVRPSKLEISLANEESSRVRGSRELIERGGKDPRLDASLLMCVGEESYDVFLAIVK